jgi:isocitrate/isopropylmalate dehydrogenase
VKTVVARGGDGIGVEVVDATCELLTAAGFPLKILTPAHGESAQRSHGYRDAKHLTRDQGGTATTRELCRAVLDALR